MKVAVLGGLGLMAGPMAIHWKKSGPVQVLRVLDRGNAGEYRDRCRKQWKNHGASLVDNLDALIGKGDIDGVFVCCGKNADDLPLLSELTKRLSALPPKKFICHMSTVSCDFALAAKAFCDSKNVDYVNYPLTGGAVGAEKGTMLILASGDETLFKKLEPGLTCLGTPRYFGERVAAAAEVKFIGHLMVFNGLLGISSAVATHAECFTGGAIDPSAGDFFDFLNTGAGGTRQWDLVMTFGIRRNTWNIPFYLKYAVVDAIYVAQLCRQRNLSYLIVDAMLNIVLAFSYVLNEVGDLATQSIVREMVQGRAKDFDAFLLKNSAPRGDLQGGLERAIASLPESIRDSVGLEITAKHFSAIR